ncbi:hypothetical protein Cni_G13219 [Canna indica]|uniref:Uncharacterized protein n=1 Tax=Canna indica TaxID=4628 RepID=A0AAQ3QCW9_9LILI|nr:hypothetical protein Cni_G13219 [Canna indica]
MEHGLLTQNLGFTCFVEVGFPKEDQSEEYLPEEVVEQDQYKSRASNLYPVEQVQSFHVPSSFSFNNSHEINIGRTWNSSTWEVELGLVYPE